MNALTMLGRLTLPGMSSAVPLARHMADRVLTTAGYVNLDAVLLLVSELATNAVVHTRSGRVGGTLTVEISESCDAWSELGECIVRIEIVDGGSLSVPAPRAPDPDSGSGRGLWLVDAMADKWGFWETQTSRGVWFEMELRADEMRRSATWFGTCHES